jgi:Ferritin-like domain
MAARSDVELMEELLVREHALLSAYEAALKRDAIDAELGATLRDHERDHVRALEQSLAGGAARNPRASVPSAELEAALGGRGSFARFAVDQEGSLVAHYAATVPRIRNARLRQPLGSIMACGAAHVVALRESLGSRYLTY